MKVEKLGKGKAEYTVVGGIHGDEPCGKNAIEKFLTEDWDIKKPVKFIIANEKALAEGTRYIDWDLNRSFPGDERSHIHEERLAAEIMEEVQDTKVLDIHSTKSFDQPFSTFSRMNKVTYNLMRSAGVERGIYFSPNEGSLNEQQDGIVVEAGHQGSDKASENAYKVLVNFLASEGVIDADFERTEPELFKYYHTIKKGGKAFTAQNFRLVKKGEVFAKKGARELRADEDFYPVLMSTNGYEDILSHKARKIDKDEYL